MVERHRPLAALAVTQGDPSGIGVEIAIKAWRERTPLTPAFFLLADPDHVARQARDLGLPAPVEACAPADAARVFGRALPVVPLAARVRG